MPTIKELFNIDEYPFLNSIEDTEVSTITLNSKKATKGSIFVAIKGEKADGHEYIKNAEEKGAVLALVSHRVENVKIPQIISKNIYKDLGNLCQKIYGTKDLNIHTIGVTGTDGKTSTAYITYTILQRLGIISGFIGTIGTQYPGHLPTHAEYTTPFAPQLHQIAGNMKNAGVQALCMETSSHSAVQHRLEGINIDIQIFTNLTHDHLDYHKTMKNYADAKASLFKNLSKQSYAILNGDDLTSMYIYENTDATRIFYKIHDKGEIEGQNFQSVLSLDDGIIHNDSVYEEWYKGLKNAYPQEKTDEFLNNSTIYEASDISDNDNIQTFTLTIKRKNPIRGSKNNGNFIMGKTEIEQYKVKLAMPGRYNIYNFLAACAAIDSLYPNNIENIITAVETPITIPGRRVYIDEGQPYQVVVDFAHTPGAIQALLSDLKSDLNNIRDKNKKGKLWVLCNSSGDRDEEKRPVIASICEKYADEIILTLEETGKELPNKILNDIYAGFSRELKNGVIQDKHLHICPFRPQAIKEVINRIQPGDIFVIPSLGDEDKIRIGDGLCNYNDSECVKQCIRNYYLYKKLGDTIKDDIFKQCMSQWSTPEEFYE